MTRKRAGVGEQPGARRKLLLGAGALSLLALGLAMVLVRSVMNAPAREAAWQPHELERRGFAAASRATAEGTGSGLAALSRAAAENKYLFAILWRVEDERTAAMRQVVESATAKVAERALIISLRADDPAASVFAARYDLRRAPMPVVLAIAPNGAITGGFPTQVQEQDLLNAIATPGTETCMKALQDGKSVFLCIQNESTTFNKEALQGVQEIQADPRYAAATATVVLDPHDPAETPFLQDLNIDPQTATAVTAFLAPPGSVIGTYQGATSKGQLIAALQQANTSCGPEGCGPDGCAPR